MTDVEESSAEIQSTANIEPTIDADQLAEPDILWVSGPRIEEDWQEVQPVRKSGARVGECGAASRTEASIDETPDRANQGMVCYTEVRFTALSSFSCAFLSLLFLGLGVTCWLHRSLPILGSSLRAQLMIPNWSADLPLSCPPFLLLLQIATSSCYIHPDHAISFISSCLLSRFCSSMPQRLRAD